MGFVDLIPADNHAADIWSVAIWLMRIAQDERLEDGSSIEAHGIVSVCHYRGPKFQGRLPEKLQPTKAEVMKLYRSLT
jgi:hypothetical protein